MLDTPVNNTGFGSGNQIQVFNIADFNPSSSSVIPVSVGFSSSYSNYASRLTRWGTNGLAFRASVDVYSLRSQLVKDLSTTSADVGVTLATTGPTVTSSTATYTATVSNAGPVDSQYGWTFGLASLHGRSALGNAVDRNMLDRCTGHL